MHSALPLQALWRRRNVADPGTANVRPDFPHPGMLALWLHASYDMRATLRSRAVDRSGVLDFDGIFQRLQTTMKLYVGNLPYSMTEEELQAAFAAHGEVT